MEAATRVAIVTGSSRGIGAEVARRLGRDGFRIVVNYASSLDPAQAVADAITAQGGQAIVVKADVASSSAVAAMFDAAQQAFGGVDVVVNCAGVLRLAPVSEFDDETFDQMVGTNVKGTFNMCREAMRRLRAGGRIINFSSSVIGLRLPAYGVYIATKSAVEGLTGVLAQEARGRGMTVNAVAPGPVATELFLTGKSEALIEQMTKMNPLERLGQPEDIARVVAFLAGEDGGWVNGQVLRANGGMC